MEQASNNIANPVVRHPDLFTPERAAEYLWLDPNDGKKTLEHLRETKKLVGVQIGRRMMYLREDLDRCVRLIRGEESTVERRPQRRGNLAKSDNGAGLQPTLKISRGEV